MPHFVTAALLAFVFSVSAVPITPSAPELQRRVEQFRLEGFKEVFNKQIKGITRPTHLHSTKLPNECTFRSLNSPLNTNPSSQAYLNYSHFSNHPPAMSQITTSLATSLLDP